MAFVSRPSEAVESSQTPGVEPPRLNASDELSRLRQASVLNSEILSSLRALRERELQRSGEQAALVAAAAEQIQSHWSALLEQISSACGPGLVTERLDSLLVDLLDYARALAGTLILERDPVHIARLLRKALAQACATSSGTPA